jgi:peptidoglycan L-alanyl-D-glutamate endopeptidase CwlK
MSTLASSLPAAPHEVPCDRSLDSLAPKFRAGVEAVLAGMRARGLDAMVAETLRTPERQAYLYGFGREYDDGRGIVTQAPTAYTSWHGFGLACDIVSRALQWDAPAEFWTALGAEARAAGLSWGGDWRQRDLPHVQFGPPMRVSPSSRALELYEQGGLKAVWLEVSAC